MNQFKIQNTLRERLRAASVYDTLRERREGRTKLKTVTHNVSGVST